MPLKTQRIKSDLPVFLIIFFACVLFGGLDFRFRPALHLIISPWLITGIALAALIIFSRRMWPAVFAGSFLAGATVLVHIDQAFWFAAACTSGAVLGAYLVERFARGFDVFDRARSVLRYSVFVGILSPALSASVITIPMFVFGYLQVSGLQIAWIAWWLGAATGGLVFAPFLIILYKNRRLVPERGLILEAALFVSLLLLFATYALISNVGFLYWIMPVLVWGAFRFRQKGTTAAILFLSTLFFIETLRGMGPFIRETQSAVSAIFLLQASMSTTFVTIMALAVTIFERSNTESTMVQYADKVARDSAVESAIIASLGEGLVFVDREGKIVVMNPVAERMLGLQPGYGVGKLHHEVIEMQDEDGVSINPADRPITHALTFGRRFEMEPLMPTRYFVKSDGTRFPVSFVVTPVEMEGAVIGAIDIFRDVTQGKEIDRAKSDFVSLASHQLRTPLSIISMYAELLRRQSGLFEKHDERECRKYSKEIEDATRRMAELINDLLNVSRIDSQTLAVNPARIDAKKLIGGIIHNLMPKVDEKKLSISVRYRDLTQRIVTDAQLLAIILQNLITNAIKYTPRSGKIRVSIAGGYDRVTFSVSDTGCGIPKNEQGEIFKKLFRAKNVRRVDSEGSGLGLYIAKSMAERLGGSIDFKSIEKKGSTFTLRLPVMSLRENPRLPSEVHSG